jgi:hypothetical protein
MPNTDTPPIKTETTDRPLTWDLVADRIQERQIALGIPGLVGKPLEHVQGLENFLGALAQSRSDDRIFENDQRTDPERLASYRTGMEPWPSPSWVAERMLTFAPSNQQFSNDQTFHAWQAGQLRPSVAWLIWALMDNGMQQGRISLSDPWVRGQIGPIDAIRPSPLPWPTIPRFLLACDCAWTRLMPGVVSAQGAQRALDQWAHGNALHKSEALNETLAAWLLIGGPIEQTAHPWVVARGAHLLHRVGAIAESMLQMPDFGGNGNYLHIKLTTHKVVELIKSLVQGMEQQGDETQWNDQTAWWIWDDLVDRLTPLMNNGRFSGAEPLRGYANKKRAEDWLRQDIPELFVRMERHKIRGGGLGESSTRRPDEPAARSPRRI